MKPTRKTKADGRTKRSRPNAFLMTFLTTQHKFDKSVSYNKKNMIFKNGYFPFSPYIFWAYIYASFRPVVSSTVFHMHVLHHFYWTHCITVNNPNLPQEKQQFYKSKNEAIRSSIIDDRLD